MSKLPHAADWRSAGFFPNRVHNFVVHGNMTGQVQSEQNAASWVLLECLWFPVIRRRVDCSFMADTILCPCAGYVSI